MNGPGKRILGGIGGGLQLLATLMPFYARGRMINDDLETLTLLALSPWLTLAGIVVGLSAIALAVSRNTDWLWFPIGGSLLVIGAALVPYQPYDYGVGIGLWVFIIALSLLTMAAAWRGKPRPAPAATPSTP